jgi:two-component system invasion response regulator UvrY
VIRLIIADDHAIVREGLKQIVASVPDMVVAGEVSDGEGLLKCLRKDDYDLVLLDITMPGQSGLEILKQLKHQRPRLPVLILSIHPEEQYAVRALRSGASGYVTKESVPRELLQAIRKAASGSTYVSSSLAKKLDSELVLDTEKQTYRYLSDREFEVMSKLAAGASIKNIAESMQLSVKTVSTYRYRILTKLRMKTNAELIRYAIENGLVH